MPGAMRVNPGEIRAAGATFVHAGDAVAAVLASLNGALPDGGEMCGDDAAGTKFAGSYNKNLAAVRKSLQAITDGLHSLGPGLATTASNIEKADGASVMKAGG